MEEQIYYGIKNISREQLAIRIWCIFIFQDILLYINFLMTSKTLHWLTTQLSKALFTPIKSIRKRYVPLLLIYFAYGASGFSSIALTFWEKENLTLSAEQLISIGVWVMVPWTLKMVFGQLVDNVPILGSRRKAYVFVGAIFMVLGTVILAGLAGENSWVMWIGDQYTIYLLSALFSTLGFVIQDVTADTMSTEVVDREITTNTGVVIPRPEAEVQSDLAMVQVLGRLALSIAIFITAGLGGYLAAHFPYEQVFWMALVIPLISCVGALFVQLETSSHQKKNALDYRILGGGLVFAVFSVVMATVDWVYSQEIVFLVSLLLLCGMMYLVTRDLSKSKLKVLVCTMMALFLYRATPGVGPGLSWWTIDVLEFDPAFFGVLKQIGAATALAVLWLFSDLISSKPIRTVLLFLVVVDTLIFLPELGLYYGVHEMIGIDARTVALFDTALESPLVNVSMVPLLALIAYYAPVGYRATWFAIGASLMNLALTAGSLLTKYLNKIFIVTREVVNEAGEVVTSADYTQLGYLMLTKFALAFVLPLAAVLIFLRKTPPVAQSKVLEEGIVSDLPEEGPIPGRKSISNE